jgi:hypothetical protein
MNWHRHSLSWHTLSNPSAILATKPSMQRGGTTMGVIVGLLVGLALALAVALYVTKVPVPFVNKVPQRLVLGWCLRVWQGPIRPTWRSGPICGCARCRPRPARRCAAAPCSQRARALW